MFFESLPISWQLSYVEMTRTVYIILGATLSASHWAILPPWYIIWQHASMSAVQGLLFGDSMHHLNSQYISLPFTTGTFEYLLPSREATVGMINF